MAEGKVRKLGKVVLTIIKTLKIPKIPKTPHVKQWIKVMDERKRGVCSRRLVFLKGPPRAFRLLAFLAFLAFFSSLSAY